MSMLRSCYRSQFRLYKDRPDVLTWGRWRFCKPGAGVVPFFHLFGSSNWDWDGRFDPPLGEVGTGARPYFKGNPLPRVKGLNTCGTREQWESGSLFAARGTMPVAPDGVPLCCLADPIGPGGDMDDGEALQGWGFILAASGGDSEDGQAEQWGDGFQAAAGGDAEDGQAEQWGDGYQAAAGGDAEDGQAVQYSGGYQLAGGGDAEDGQVVQYSGGYQLAGGGDAEDGNGGQGLGFVQLAGGGDAEDGADDQVEEYGSVWVKFTLGFAAFQTAGTTKTVTVRSIPGGEFVHQVVANVTTNFTGGAIISVSGQAKFDTSNIGASWFAHTGNSGFAASDQDFTFKTSFPSGSNLGLGSFTASKDVTITLTSMGANLDALTAGSIDVWLNLSTLP